jgi:hypothetical protein
LLATLFGPVDSVENLAPSGVVDCHLFAMLGEFFHQEFFPESLCFLTAVVKVDNGFSEVCGSMF